MRESTQKLNTAVSDWQELIYLNEIPLIACYLSFSDGRVLEDAALDDHCFDVGGEKFWPQLKCYVLCRIGSRKHPERCWVQELVRQVAGESF